MKHIAKRIGPAKTGNSLDLGYIGAVAKFLAQLAVVEYLAVVDDDQPSFGQRHRLASVLGQGDIHDAGHRAVGDNGVVETVHLLAHLPRGIQQRLGRDFKLCVYGVLGQGPSYRIPGYNLRIL